MRAVGSGALHCTRMHCMRHRLSASGSVMYVGLCARPLFCGQVAVNNHHHCIPHGAVWVDLWYVTQSLSNKATAPRRPFPMRHESCGALESASRNITATLTGAYGDTALEMDCLPRVGSAFVLSLRGQLGVHQGPSASSAAQSWLLCGATAVPKSSEVCHVTPPHEGLGNVTVALRPLRGTPHFIHTTRGHSSLWVNTFRPPISDALKGPLLQAAQPMPSHCLNP